jgi:hypothetical protein
MTQSDARGKHRDDSEDDEVKRNVDASGAEEWCELTR